jgi:hypothetical protein
LLCGLQAFAVKTVAEEDREGAKSAKKRKE